MCWSPAPRYATNGKSRSISSHRYTSRNSRMRRGHGFSIRPRDSARRISICWWMRYGSMATSCTSRAAIVPLPAQSRYRKKGSWTRCPASYQSGAPGAIRTPYPLVRRDMPDSQVTAMHRNTQRRPLQVFPTLRNSVSEKPRTDYMRANRGEYWTRILVIPYPLVMSLAMTTEPQRLLGRERSWMTRQRAQAGANTGIDTPPSVFLNVTFTFCPTFTVSRSQSTMLVIIVTPSSSVT